MKICHFIKLGGAALWIDCNNKSNIEARYSSFEL